MKPRALVAFTLALAIAACIFTILLGTGVLGAAVALGVPSCIGDRCGSGPVYAATLGSVGAALSLAGAGLLWWSWPVRIHTEPLSAHPEL